MRTVQNLPWPRRASDGTQLGIDLHVEAKNVIDIVKACFTPPASMTIDDLANETMLQLIQSNRCNSAHDPRKGGIATYVKMVTIGRIRVANRKSRRFVLAVDNLHDVADHRDPIGAWEAVNDVLDGASVDRLRREAPQGPAAGDWVTLSAGVLAVIDAAEAPLRIDEIMRRLGPRATVAGTRSTLRALAHQGRILRASLGLYTKALTAPPPRSPLSGSGIVVYRTIEAQPNSTLRDVLGRLHVAGVRLNNKHLGGVLSRLVASGHVRSDGGRRALARYTVAIIV